ncbi:hypothetical protein, unlikely [Trypanosoma brucei gambiense DAL972]|uniref:Uncharacterized protein n=1 Tax=Trypanosoma brucei gambiense (strain MHOM/CI/86/DAL972) TaxID=679716 RepID=D0A367_TRYB9|nr:hypothetical protein, unlikely [Trypanosoma brucei gambiense DAL972]CBH15711.1 hypothetical protein, unlikely [Trypanosoma brucei gambiense DAL972]|eukprot:XP_011777975.1 hypothetical protein, unlikely [Trypanosoma brucei gambiense DAL972]
MPVPVALISNAAGESREVARFQYRIRSDSKQHSCLQMSSLVGGSLVDTSQKVITEGGGHNSNMSLLQNRCGGTRTHHHTSSSSQEAQHSTASSKQIWKSKEKQESAYMPQLCAKRSHSPFFFSPP